MAWVMLVIAGLFEVGWASLLKPSEGFTRFWPTLGFLVSMITSVALLGLAVKSLPIGTAYAVWTGIGAVGTVLTGVLLLGEDADWRRLACVGLIVAGIVGLKLVSPR